MKPYGSVNELFESAASGPGGVTLVGRAGDDQFIAYDDLFERARQLTGGFVEAGLGPDRIVGLFATRSFDFFACCIAAWRCAAGILLLAPRGRSTTASWTESLRSLVAAAGAEAIFKDDVVGDVDAGIPVLDLNDLLLSGSPPREPPPPDAVALIQATSGTSGSPKASAVTYRVLWNRANAVLSEDPSPDPGGFMTWSPLHLGAGFSSGLFRPLSHGVSTTILQTSAFVSDPGRWLREISDRRISHSGGAHFGYRLALRGLERGDGRHLDLSSWRAATDGGESIDADSALEFVSAAVRHGFSPDAFRPRYSMSESMTLTERSGLQIDRLDRSALGDSIARPPREESRLDVRLVSLGAPRAGVELQIDDGSKGEREIGQIRIKSPNLADRYLSGPIHGEDGWFHTGDMGYLADGEVYITARSKDIVIVRGLNLIATDIERVVETVSKVSPGRSAALGVTGDGPERLLIVAELESNDADDCRKEVARALWREAGVVGAEIIFTEPDSLPVTGGGKLRKTEIKNAYETGRLLIID